MMTTIEKARAVYGIMEKRAAAQRREYVRGVLADYMREKSMAKTAASAVNGVRDTIKENHPLHMAMPSNPAPGKFFGNLGRRIDNGLLRGTQKVNSWINNGARAAAAAGDAVYNAGQAVENYGNDVWQGTKAYGQEAVDAAKRTGQAASDYARNSMEGYGMAGSYLSGMARNLGGRLRNAWNGARQAGLQNVQQQWNQQ